MFYSDDVQLWAIDIEAEPTLAWRDPVALFEVPPTATSYDAAPDGHRFVFVLPEEESEDQSRQIRVVLNWFEELKERVPIP